MADLLFLSSELDDMVAAIMGFYMLFGAVYSIFGVVSYVLSSLGMYTIANRRGISHAWMAWVPVLNYWTLGSISDQYQQVTKGKTTKRRVTMIVLQIVMFVLVVAIMVAAIGTVVQSLMLMDGMTDEAAMDLMGNMGFLVLAYLALLGVSITVLVFYYICLYDLYSSCNPQNGVLFLILSIFISVTTPFLIFACRNKDLGMQPKQTYYQPPVYTQYQQYPQYQQNPQYPQYQPPEYQPQPGPDGQDTQQ